MRDESGQQPPALTTRRIALGNGEPIVNPDSWRKIRKTTANIYLGSMLSYSRLVYLSALPWCPRAPQQASLRRPAIWWRGGGVCRPSRDHAATEKLAHRFESGLPTLVKARSWPQYSRRMRWITDAPASITLANVPSASQRWRRVRSVCELA
jgi:hypothetical protein